MSTAPDRITELLTQNRVTGIDFIYVHPDQKSLDIFFLRKVTDLIDVPDLTSSLKPFDIRIYSPASALPEIEVESIMGWQLPADGQHVLNLKTKQRGDFSLYNFVINDPELIVISMIFLLVSKPIARVISIVSHRNMNAHLRN